MNEFIESYIQKNKIENEQVKLHFQRLKQENLRVDTIARDREHQLRLLSNPDAVKKYKDLLRGFNTVLQENSKEKEKQLSAMGQVLTMIED